MIFDDIKQFLKKLFGTQKGASMAKSKMPKLDEIDIIVTKLPAPTTQWPQGYSFEMKRGSKYLGKKLEFQNHGHPGFIIYFSLQEGDPHHPTGCQFLPDLPGVMWVQQSDLPDPPCPRYPCTWEQFSAIDVVKNEDDEPNRGLIVSNRNDFQKMFAFTLRFEIPGYPDVVEFDPIGSNQNGGD